MQSNIIYTLVGPLLILQSPCLLLFLQALVSRCLCSLQSQGAVREPDEASFPGYA